VIELRSNRPQVRIAPPQQINCKVSLNFLKASLGMPDGYIVSYCLIAGSIANSLICPADAIDFLPDPLLDLFPWSPSGPKSFPYDKLGNAHRAGQAMRWYQ
jgi:hypothetical protein